MIAFSCQDQDVANEKHHTTFATVAKRLDRRHFYSLCSMEMKNVQLCEFLVKVSRATLAFYAPKLIGHVLTSTGIIICTCRALKGPTR